MTGKKLLVHFSIGLAFNLACYFAVAFVQWDLAWIRLLPSYSRNERACMLIPSLALNFYLHLILKWWRGS